MPPFQMFQLSAFQSNTDLPALIQQSRILIGQNGDAAMLVGGTVIKDVVLLSIPVVQKGSDPSNYRPKVNKNVKRELRKLGNLPKFRVRLEDNEPPKVQVLETSLNHPGGVAPIEVALLDVPGQNAALVPNPGRGRNADEVTIRFLGRVFIWTPGSNGKLPVNDAGPNTTPDFEF